MTNPAREQKKRGVFLGEVLDNVPLCHEHFKVTVRIEGFPPSEPGQFVQLQCRPPVPQTGSHPLDWPQGGWPKPTQAELTDKEPLLRRPLSIAGRRDKASAGEIDLIYRTVGTGTTWLAGVEAGQTLSVLGPLGNGFTIGEGKYAAMIGGGVGIPPMIYQGEALAQAGKQTVAFCGTRSGDMLPVTLSGDIAPATAGEPTMCIGQFAGFGIGSVIATDDGSLGYPGLVSEAFGRWLVTVGINPKELTVYSCGPEPMMQAVGEICIRHGCDCQLALERHMACGMGTCQSCAVKIRDDSDLGWSYKLCCTDGPIFDAHEIIWH